MPSIFLFRISWALFLLGLAHPILAKTIAEVVWVDNSRSADGGFKYRILHSQYDGQEWSRSKTAYESENALTTPTIATMSDSSKVLVWSEQISTQVVLNTRQLTAGKWGETSLLSAIGVENLAPSLVQTPNQQLWVFWSAHQNDNDDIYQSQYLGAQRWAKARRVHDKNTVSDHAVSAQIDPQGDIVLTWKSYSPTFLNYQVASKNIDVKYSNNQSLIGLSDDKDLSILDILPPYFLPVGALHTVHFPHNKLTQSLKLNER